MYHYRQSLIHKGRQQERKKRTWEIQNNQKTIRRISKSLPLDKYFKCKWNKFTNQNVQSG